MFGLKKIDIGNFGNGIVPKFKVTELSIEKIHNGIHKTQVENKKNLKTSGDIFRAINRRYNKFRYAYYTKGPDALDKEKVNRCYQKTKRFLSTLRHMHRKLLAADDPRAENFGKHVAEANDTVQKYGAYIMKLNQGKCPVPQKINENRAKVKPNRKNVRSRNRNY